MANAISNDLIQELTKLGQTIVSKFTPPEFIPGCEVISVADIHEYATNNGWVEAVCGQHNQQRVRWKLAETVANGDFIDVLYFQDRQIFEAYGVGGSTAVSSGPGAWPAPGKVNIGTTQYATLAAAVAAAVSGDTIYAGVGTHTADDVTIPAGIDLWGADPYQTIFTSSVSLTTLTFAAGAKGGNFTVTNTTSSASVTSGVTIASNNVRLIRVFATASNPGAGHGRGFIVSGGNTTELHQCQGSGKTHGIYISGAATAVALLGGIYSQITTDTSSPTIFYYTPPYTSGETYGAGTTVVGFAVSSGLFSSQAFTASRAVVTGTSKQLITSSVTSTELGYVGGVTSAIQAQIDAIAAPPAASETVAGVAELATQAETNAGTDDARIVTPLKHKVAHSGVAVYNNAALSIAASTPTVLTFNSERRDDAGFHSTSSNTGRLTVPTGYAGWYNISVGVEWAANATGTYRQIYFQINGTTVPGADKRVPLAAGVLYWSMSTLYYLNDADYIEIVALHDASASVNINSSGNYSPEFRMVRVG